MNIECARCDDSSPTVVHLISLLIWSSFPEDLALRLADALNIHGHSWFRSCPGVTQSVKADAVSPLSNAGQVLTRASLSLGCFSGMGL